MAKSIKEYVKKVRVLRGWYRGKRADDMTDIMQAINMNAEVLASMIDLYEASQKETARMLAELKSESYYQLTKEAADRL